MDSYTINFDYLGTRTTVNNGGTYLGAGQRWKDKIPSGITKVLGPETEFINVVGRTQLLIPRTSTKSEEHPIRVQSAVSFRVPGSTRSTRPASDSLDRTRRSNPDEDLAALF